MLTEELVIKFEGGMADSHELPAYDAARSIAGISRSILIPVTYLELGRVRKRNLVNTRAFQLNLTAQREGSFESVLKFVADPTLMAIINAVGVNLTVELIKEFTYSVISRSIGGSANEKIEEMEASGVLNVGDMAALVEAIEPAMRDAHASIGNGATNVFVISGDNNVVHLNAASKRYISTSIEDDTALVKEFSVGSFNANTGNGRVYDYEAGRTIPFSLDDDADALTINSIVESMRRYARARRLGDDLKSRLALQYSAIYAPDDRVKRIHVFEARLTMDEIGGDLT